MDLKALEKRLGYHFKNAALIERALTHSSATSRDGIDDYERLEFLGDRVLALLTAEALYAAYPNVDEGGLATRLNALVRRETCTSVAQSIGLSEFIIMSDTDHRTGGPSNQSILADVCESVLGAIYLDGGLEASRSFYAAHWMDRLDDLHITPRDAKSALQEWAQGQGYPLPLYKMIGRQGPDHAPHFQMEVMVTGLTPCQGEGPSKRLAEQDAATNFLRREGEWEDDT